ncbi:hypothetical protein M0722_12860 [Microbacterium sp. KSW4-16]|uniref:hypothetical protein n=1 Tax=Microbacterium aurugineum TaxID=2851642 RepID=UPI0020C0A730|nr:hypothetical protein [Microbacterium aurugineum]MCK8468086.1 hypothetical protein [Microbacterium aurugineum]
MATYRKKSALAAHLQISPRTVDLWHSKDYITGYLDETGSLVYNLEEVELAIALSNGRMRDGRKRGKNGVVKPKPIQAVSE